MIGVYILEFDNGYKYIGSSKDVKRRIRDHRYHLKQKNMGWYKLTTDINLSNTTIIECKDIASARTIEMNLIAFSNCNLYNKNI